MTDSPVLRLREVARYLNVHPNTVYRLAQRGLLPAFKVGSDWRFNRESIDRWRLEQERTLAQSISGQETSSQPLTDELFHVVYWYQAEGFRDSVGAADVALFVRRAPKAISRELNRLAQTGLLVKKTTGRQRGYSLTPQGLSQARQLFGEARPATAGHASLVQFELQRQGQPAWHQAQSFGPASLAEGRE